MDPLTLKQMLLEKYQNKSLEDLNNLKLVETSQGEVLNINSTSKIEFMLKSQNKAFECLLNDLKLVKGIGEAKEKKLKRDGYQTLEDLMEHPRFGEYAEHILNLICSADTKNIVNLLTDRYGPSHPQMLNTCCFSEVEDLVFMDIETLGLKNRPVILLGEASIKGNKIMVNQYLLKDLTDEPAVLAAHLESINEESVYVTFNGRSFDVPYIRDRLDYYNLPYKLEHHHIDLLLFSRRFYGSKLANCQLTTLEEYLLDMERVDDVPGYMVPDFYKTYLETGNIGPLIPIIDHNRDDIISLARIISFMLQEQG
ncbi:MAG: ribonuclease H-like domain-containing protein [Methanobacteriaceae archaeon]|nr:ribonuclease H-like domain-containing protein [Methanobacteriaceae archaeon]